MTKCLKQKRCLIKAQIAHIICLVLLSACKQVKDEKSQAEGMFDTILAVVKPDSGEVSDSDRKRCPDIRRRAVHYIADYAFSHPQDFGMDLGQKNHGDGAYGGWNDYEDDQRSQASTSLSTLRWINTPSESGSSDDQLKYTEVETNGRKSKDSVTIKTHGAYTYILQDGKIAVYKTWKPSDLKKIREIDSTALARTVSDVFPEYEKYEKEIKSMILRDFPNIKGDSDIRNSPVENLNIRDFQIEGNKLYIAADAEFLLKPSNPASYDMEKTVNATQSETVAYVSDTQRQLYNRITNQDAKTRVFVIDLSNPESLVIKNSVGYQANYKSMHVSPDGAFVMMGVGFLYDPLVDILYKDNERIRKISKILSPNFIGERGTESDKKFESIKEAVMTDLEEYIYTIVSYKQIESLIPLMSSYDKNGEQTHVEPIFKCENLIKPTDSKHTHGVFVVGRVPEEGGDQPAASGILDTFSLTYTINDHLYLTHGGGEGNAVKTFISAYQLKREGMPIELLGKGYVQGALASIAYINEYNNYLRIFTNSRGGTAQLTILKIDDETKRLETVSRLRAPENAKNIHSMYFHGSMAYIAAQIDYENHFIAFNLSNPDNPKILYNVPSEGDFRFIYPLDDSHLLLIGKTKEYERTSRNRTWVRVYEFASDEKPKVTAKYIFPNWTTSFDTGYPVNIDFSQGFAYDVKNRILAVPTSNRFRNEKIQSYHDTFKYKNWPKGLLATGYVYLRVENDKIEKIASIDIEELYCNKFQPNAGIYKCEPKSIDELYTFMMSGRVNPSSSPEIYLYTYGEFGLFTMPLDNPKRITSVFNK